MSVCVQGNVLEELLKLLKLEKIEKISFGARVRIWASATYSVARCWGRRCPPLPRPFPMAREPVLIAPFLISRSQGK